MYDGKTIGGKDYDRSYLPLIPTLENLKSFNNTSVSVARRVRSGQKPDWILPLLDTGFATYPLDPALIDTTLRYFLLNSFGLGANPED